MTDEELGVFLRATFPLENVGPLTRAQRVAIHAAADRLAARPESYAKALHKALWLFREFTLRNATQWEVGSGHHHPIWSMIAELIGEQGGIVSGPAYRFIMPGNEKTLDELEND